MPQYNRSLVKFSNALPGELNPYSGFWKLMLQIDTYNNLRSFTLAETDHLE